MENVLDFRGKITVQCGTGEKITTRYIHHSDDPPSHSSGDEFSENRTL